MTSTFSNTVRACGATTLALILAACGGGGGSNSNPGGATVLPPLPVTAQSITVAGDASQVLVGSKPVTLTATLATPASVTWTIAEGPGTLSAASGATVNYVPPAAGVSANTRVIIKATASDASKTYRVTVYPDPGEPGLSLIAGTLGSYGNLDGAGTAARFGSIIGGIVDIAPDASGNLFVVTTNGLRKVSAAGRVSTVDLPISSGISYLGGSVAPDNTAYLLAVDNGKYTVLKVLADNTLARFLMPSQTDQSSKKIVAGPNGVIYLIGNAHISTVDANGNAGIMIGKEEDKTSPCRDGVGADARLGVINDAVLDAAGNLIVQACSSVRKITPAGVVTTLAGDLGSNGTPKDGVGATAHFGNYQASVAIDKSGNIRVLDFDQPVQSPDATVPAGGKVFNTAYRLRKVTAGGAVTTVASGTYRLDVPAIRAIGRASPLKLVRYLSNGTVIVSKSNELLKLADDGTLSTFAGNEGDITVEMAGTVATARFINPRSISADLAGNLYVLDEVTPQWTTAYKISISGQVTKILDTDVFSGRVAAKDIIASPDGTVYITHEKRQLAFDPALHDAGAIYRLTANGTLQLLAGSSADTLVNLPRKDGTGSAADFYRIVPIGFDADGNLYVRDDGPTAEVQEDGGFIYRKITPQGSVSTVSPATMVSALPPGLRRAPEGYTYYVDGYRYFIDEQQGVVNRRYQQHAYGARRHRRADRQQHGRVARQLV